MQKLIRMMSTMLFILTFYVFTLQSQELSLQELVNRKQFPEVLARTDSLTAGRFCELCNYVGHRAGL